MSAPVIQSPSSSSSSGSSSSNSSHQPSNTGTLRGRPTSQYAVSSQQNVLPHIAACVSEVLDYVVDFFQLNPQRIKLSKEYGAGIRNAGNSCYIDSVLQSVRASINLEELPPSNEAVTATRKELQSIFDILEGKGEQQLRTLTVDELNKVRGNVINSGFLASYSSQEDASQFSEFLLDKLGIPTFETVTTSTHQYGEPLHANVPDNQVLYLGMVNNEERCKIEDLLLGIVVEDEKERFLPLIKKEVDVPENIKTIQSISLVEDTLPQLLPICLKRYTFNREFQVLQKISSFVEPSQEIEIPIFGDHNNTAVYTLSAFITHEGTNPQIGHYTSYIPKNVNGESALLEYNSNSLHLYLHPQQDIKTKNETMFENAGKNGYIFFYKLKEIR